MNINWNNFREDVNTVWFDDEGKCYAHGDGHSSRIPYLDNAENACKTFTSQSQVKAKQIDWSLVPDWAEYVAMDADGVAVVFEEEPKTLGDFWVSSDGITPVHYAKEELYDYIDRSHWRSSLARRPAMSDAMPELIMFVNGEEVEAPTPGFNEWIAEEQEKLEEACRPHGNKYHRYIRGQQIDVYDVLQAFAVNNPATQHAIKKLLMPGTRGHKSTMQDYREALASIERAIELEEG